MGASCMKSEQDEEEESEYADKYRGHHENNNNNNNRHNNRRLTTVAMLASMAHQAGDLVQHVAHTPGNLDPMDYQERVRMAKAEMRTVSIRNDCLYIDYEFIGRIPPGMASMAY